MFYVQWQSSIVIREIYGLRFEPGEIKAIENEEVAMDLVTQPGEPFALLDEIEVARLRPDLIPVKSIKKEN